MPAHIVIGLTTHAQTIFAAGVDVGREDHAGQPDDPFSPPGGHETVAEEPSPGRDAVEADDECRAGKDSLKLCCSGKAGPAAAGRLDRADTLFVAERAYVALQAKEAAGQQHGIDRLPGRLFGDLARDDLKPFGAFLVASAAFEAAAEQADSDDARVSAGHGIVPSCSNYITFAKLCQ
jgi:hypothetical protein